MPPDGTPLLHGQSLREQLERALRGQGPLIPPEVGGHQSVMVGHFLLLTVIVHSGHYVDFPPHGTLKMSYIVLFTLTGQNKILG